jgi:hypothetical protein
MNAAAVFAPRYTDFIGSRPPSFGPTRVARHTKGLLSIPAFSLPKLLKASVTESSQPMTALGHEPMPKRGPGMSASPPTADLVSVAVNVCIVPQADISTFPPLPLGLRKGRRPKSRCRRATTSQAGQQLASLRGGEKMFRTSTQRPVRSFCAFNDVFRGGVEQHPAIGRTAMGWGRQ